MCLKLKFQPHFFPLLSFGFSHTEVISNHCMFNYNSMSLISSSLWKALLSSLCLVNSYLLFKTQPNSLLHPLLQWAMSSALMVSAVTHVRMTPESTAVSFLMDKAHRNLEAGRGSDAWEGWADEVR